MSGDVNSAPAVSDAEVALDVNDLTLGEALEVEEKTGRLLGELFPNGGASVAGLRGLYWIFRRRHDPEFTWEASGEVRLTTLVDLVSDQHQG